MISKALFDRVKGRSSREIVRQNEAARAARVGETSKTDDAVSGFYGGLIILGAVVGAVILSSGSD